MAQKKAKRAARNHAPTVLALATLTAGGCTAILGIDGNYRLGDGGGGAGASTTGSAPSGSGAGNQQGGGGSGTGAGNQGGGGDGDITGMRSVIQRVFAKDTATPADFSAGDATIEVIGEAKSFAGKPTGANGEGFVITGVPAGPYLLHYKKNNPAGTSEEEYVWLQSRTGVDLRVFTGAPQAPSPVTDSSATEIQITGMTPWTVTSPPDADAIDFFAPGTGAFFHWFDGEAEQDFHLSDGSDAIDITGADAIDWSTLAPDCRSPVNRHFYRVRQSDTSYLIHFGMGPNGYPILRDIKKGQLTNDMALQHDPTKPFRIGQGAAFDNVGADASFVLAADPQAFVELGTAINAVSGVEFQVDYQVSPGPLKGAGVFTDAAHLFTHTTGDSVPAAYQFGKPGALDDWTPFVSIGVVGTIVFRAPTATVPLGQDHQPLGACLYDVNDAATIDRLKDPTRPITPELSPVTQAKVDGHLFTEDTAMTPMTLGSTRPTISWTSAPGMRSFRVSATEVIDSGGGTTTGETVAFRAAGDFDSVRFPPGLLKPGTSYMFQVRAESCKSCDQDHQPLVSGIPSCWSLAISNAFDTPAH